jgi:ribonuclease P protein component
MSSTLFGKAYDPGRFQETPWATLATGGSTLGATRNEPPLALTQPAAGGYPKCYRRVHSHTQAQGEVCFEANVPTEPQTQVKDTRLPDPDAHARWPQYAPAAAPEGPASPDPMNAGRRPHAFPKHLRLLRRNEFRRVYEEGKRRSTPLCTVFIRSNGLDQSRLGLTVPAAVGSAPLRNRIKRRVREVFRLNRAAIPGGWDIVVNPRKDAARAPFATLTRDLMRLFPAQPPVAVAPQDTPRTPPPETAALPMRERS